MKRFRESIHAGDKDETSSGLRHPKSRNPENIVFYLVAKSFKMRSDHIDERLSAFGFPHRAEIQDILNQHKLGFLCFCQPYDFFKKKVAFITFSTISAERESLTRKSGQQNIGIGKIHWRDFSNVSLGSMPFRPIFFQCKNTPRVYVGGIMVLKSGHLKAQIQPSGS